MSRGPKPAAPRPGAKRQAAKIVNLALQGGGSHGAYTWGVLDALGGGHAHRDLGDQRRERWDHERRGVRLRDERRVDGTALARSSRCSGSRFHRKARSRRSSAVGSTRRLRRGAASGPGPAGSTPGPRRCRELSPYEFNPFNVNPLRTHLEQVVDFDRLRATDGLQLFVAATNVWTGRGHIFRRDILTADHVMASACLPICFNR